MRQPHPGPSQSGRFSPHHHGMGNSNWHPGQQGYDFTHSVLAPLKVMSNHLLQESLLSKGMPKFDGTPHQFHPWIGKFRGYVSDLDLASQPEKELQLLEALTTKEPNKTVVTLRAKIGTATHRDVEEVWRRLTVTYGSSEVISADLESMMNKASAVSEGPNIGKQLIALYDTCSLVASNLQRCPQLCYLHSSSGRRQLRSLLPLYIQRKWQKWARGYQEQHGLQPTFQLFTDFILMMAEENFNTSYNPIQYSASKKVSKTGRGATIFIFS